MSLMVPPMTVECHRFLLMLPKSEVVPCMIQIRSQAAWSLIKPQPFPVIYAISETSCVSDDLPGYTTHRDWVAG